MNTGIELIAKERQRQIEKEGYTAVTDARYKDESIALAAVSYALPEKIRFLVGDEGLWPWAMEYWKPTTRLRDLVKAGALIAAEIDRLQHQEGHDLSSVVVVDREVMEMATHAMQSALQEMRNTTAPRTSFTDAVDDLDSALARLNAGGEG